MDSLGPLELLLMGYSSADGRTVIEETPPHEIESYDEQSATNTPKLFSSPEPECADEEFAPIEPLQLHTVVMETAWGARSSEGSRHPNIWYNCTSRLPIDKNAIAFQCYVESKWYTFGQ